MVEIRRWQLQDRRDACPIRQPESKGDIRMLNCRRQSQFAKAIPVTADFCYSPNFLSPSSWGTLQAAVQHSRLQTHFSTPP
ncbi:MAG: hypothetical protein KME26_31845 [Oscillatoria princeps RMCB-10]|nr:hypothetical protein [Oscillatoria princeps RMCB-10]